VCSPSSRSGARGKPHGPRYRRSPI
jgi:hypothetical protein